MKSLLVLMTAFAVSLTVARAQAKSYPLSQEGEKQKTLHEFLFGSFLEGRDPVYWGNGRDRGLKELTVVKETREIRNGDEIVLPVGAERVAVFFRHFGFHGENLDQIKEVRVLPFSPDKAPPRSVQVKDFYRVQMPSLPLTDEPIGTMKFRFLMKEGASCRIDDVVFYAQKAIPPEFDSIPYRDLGSEHPRERVVIKVDAAHELVIGETAELQGDRWFRMHEIPGSVDASFEKWAFERGFLPGRGAFKFHPALTKSWGGQKTLKESAEKPGAADLTLFDRYDSGVRLRKAIPEIQKKSFALCFNDWPEFMSVPLRGRGTPLEEHFDDAADLAAAYAADQVKDAGRTATWWEVKNESSVKSEWDHHFAKGKDGWGLLADFHNRVADAVHEKAPGTMVGGPSSAYMQVQVSDFGLYKNQARFIKETRGHIDFFSHHFYENAGMLGAHERRGMGYSNYLLGRYEAILDMLRAQMHKVDNVLPILITETGSLQNGRKPSDNWLRLVAWNAYLTKSMQRPDQIDMYVPFIFLHMPWNPISGDAAFTPKEGVKWANKMKDFEPTVIARYFDLWDGFAGRRLPVSFDRGWLDVVAVHNDDEVLLAVTNMGGRQIAADFSGISKEVGSTGAKQTRLNYHKGEVVYEAAHAVDAAAIPVDVNETTVIRLALPIPLTPQGALKLNRWYATETAVKSDGEALSMEIGIKKPGAVKSAKIFVGLHRVGGISEPVSVEVNGTTIELDLGDAGEFSEFFAQVDADVPSSLLKEKNAVMIKAEKGATVTSVHLETLNEQ